jgi:hypothetical protein
VRQVDRAFDGGRIKVLARHREMEVDLGEDLRVFAGALGFQRHRAADDFLTALLQDHHDVVRRTAARAEQHHFHRARRQIAAATFRCAVHGDEVATARFGGECHAVLTHPADFAFHACTPARLP